jgi:integrase
MPIKEIKPRPPMKTIRRTVSHEEIRLLLDFAEQDGGLSNLTDVVKLISNTGIRPGELCRVRWTDVDVNRRRLLVVDAEGFCGRSVPLGPKTCQMLEVRREREPEAEYIFRKSRPAFLPRVSQQLRTVSDRIGFSGITLHLLRRSFFERLSLSGASRESFVIFGRWRSPLWTTESILTPDQRFEVAACDQARIEEL